MVVYMTINLINGKRYIGADSKNNPKYLGSGVILLQAIKKYGKSNFKKIILEECRDQNHLREREIYWVTYYDASENSDFYNLSLGGQGGVLGHRTWNEGMNIKSYPVIYEKMYANRKPANKDYITEEWRSNHSDAILSSKKFQNNKDNKIETRRKNNETWHSDETKRKIGIANSGRIRTAKEIEKRIKTIKERGSLSGKNNGMSIGVTVIDTLTDTILEFSCKKDVINKLNVSYYEISKRKSSDKRYIFKF